MNLSAVTSSKYISHRPQLKPSRPHFSGLVESKPSRDPNDPYWNIHEGYTSYKTIVEGLKNRGDEGRSTLNKMLREGFDSDTFYYISISKSGKPYENNSSKLVTDLMDDQKRADLRQAAIERKREQDRNITYAIC